MGINPALVSIAVIGTAVVGASVTVAVATTIVPNRSISVAPVVGIAVAVTAVEPTSRETKADAKTKAA